MTKNEIGNKIAELLDYDVLTMVQKIKELAVEVREEVAKEDEKMICRLKLNTGEDLLTPKEAIEIIQSLRKAVRGDIHVLVDNYNGYIGKHVETKKIGETAFFNREEAYMKADWMNS